MKLSGVLFVLAFVALVVFKSHPAWLFGTTRTTPSIRIREATPAERLEQWKAHRRAMPRPALTPLAR